MPFIPPLREEQSHHMCIYLGFITCTERKQDLKILVPFALPQFMCASQNINTFLTMYDSNISSICYTL